MLSSWNKVIIIISSPEPKAYWWAYRIGRPPSSVCVYVCMCVCTRVYQHFQTSSQKPLGRLKLNFIQSLHGMGERKFVQTVLVTWPRWPPCLYMVKTLKKSSPEPKGRWPWNFVCSIGCASTIKFVQIMTMGWPWPILRQGQLWSLMLLCGKKIKQWIFSETIVVYDIKVGRCS